MRKSRLIQQFDAGQELIQARFVNIAHRRLAVWADPFRMLSSQVLMNLLLKFGQGASGMTDHDLSGHNWRRSEHKNWTKDARALFIENSDELKNAATNALLLIFSGQKIPPGHFSRLFHAEQK
jgi:hypothetical protein